MLNPNVVLKNLSQNTQFNAVMSLVARVLMAYIFIVAGWGKVTAYQATAAYMESMGVPAALLPIFWLN